MFKDLLKLLDKKYTMNLRYDGIIGKYIVRVKDEHGRKAETMLYNIMDMKDNIPFDNVLLYTVEGCIHAIEEMEKKE